MHEEIVQQLLTLNREFYNGFADSFSNSRQRPQPCFFQLLESAPRLGGHLLDVGCGDGRFGRFLFEHEAITQYTGVDLSSGLLNIAKNNVDGDFYERDMIQDGFLDGLGQFDNIACLAALQHVPGRANRARLLREFERHLAPNGRLLLSTWQFMNSPRQRRKIQPWNVINVEADAVEENDYLLSWKRDGLGYRYVCFIDEGETAVLARAANLKIETLFYSDGKEGNLSLYTTLEKNAKNNSEYDKYENNY